MPSEGTALFSFWSMFKYERSFTASMKAQKSILLELTLQKQTLKGMWTFFFNYHAK